MSSVGEQATVLHETSRGLEATGQVYELVRTYEVPILTGATVATATTVRHKVRVTVHVDNYIDQCRYLAEVWTTGAGWAQVARINGADPWFSAKRMNLEPLVSGYDRTPGAKEGFLEKVAVSLLERAVAVLS